MKIKLGIIGTGNITKRVIPVIRNTNLYDILVIKSRSIEKAKNFSKKENIPYFINNIYNFTKYDINTVYIASKSFVHYEEIIELLKLKINVICEKPLVLKSYELEEIINLCKKNNLICFHAHKTIYLSNYFVLKNFVVNNDFDNYYFSFSKNNNSNKLSKNKTNLFSRDIYDLYFYPLALGIEFLVSKYKNCVPTLDIKSLKFTYKYKEYLYNKPIEISFDVKNEADNKNLFKVYANYVDDFASNISYFRKNEKYIFFKTCSNLNKIWFADFQRKNINSSFDDLFVFKYQFIYYFELINKHKYQESLNILKNTKYTVKIIEQINNYIKNKYLL